MRIALANLRPAPSADESLALTQDAIAAAAKRGSITVILGTERFADGKLLATAMVV